MLKRPEGISTEQKALSINLDDNIYGTIVEIGAGQETARQFFKAGAAAGTIAKTSSAYDMTVSDAIYGKAGRYVSRERVQQMLKHEFQLCLDRLTEVRPPESRFFSYAATVSARNFKGDNECHGWIGLRLQLNPGEEPSEVLCHVRMLDSTNELQSLALGTLGVNLIHSAFNHHDNPYWLIESLSDNLGDDRIEVDLIDFSGPGFEQVDNRLTNLHLVTSWLTRAVVFDANGNPAVPRDLIYKKPVAVMRASFKPPTLTHNDMERCGVQQLAKEQDLEESNILRLAEVSMSQLMSDNQINQGDFLLRVDLANAMGYSVVVSDYFRYFKLRSWFRRHTKEALAILMKSSDINDFLFKESLYEGLEGGPMEGLGKLFADNTSVFVYPVHMDGEKHSLDDIEFPQRLEHIAHQIRQNGKLIDMQDYDESRLHISARKVVKQITQAEEGWENSLCEEVTSLIKERQLFGYSE